MPERGPEEQLKGISEALRDAIERTFAATAGSASDTRERANELLDEVTRRGGEAREQLTRRGSEARDQITRRGSEARDQVSRRGAEAREALGDVVASLRSEVESLRRRLAELESKPKPKD